jgi:hypothetical protein
MLRCAAPLVVLLLACSVLPAAEPPSARPPKDDAERKSVRLRGEVLDAGTDKPLPARVYVQGADGSWHFARSEAKNGSAVAYRKQRPPKSVEMHTTLSAHPFRLDLPPGKYTITVERGKEYLPLSRQVAVGTEPVKETFRLKRWADMAGRGWYSGETHVHRSLAELPNVMLAEDLNVAFPLLSWVTEAFAAPGRISLNPDCGFASGKDHEVPLEEAYLKLKNLGIAARQFRERHSGAVLGKPTASASGPRPWPGPSSARCRGPPSTSR